MTQTEGPVEQTQANVQGNEDPRALRLSTIALLASSLGGIADILTVIGLVEEQKTRDLFILFGFLFVGGPVLYIWYYNKYNRSKRFGFALIVSLLLMAAVGGLAGVYGLKTPNQSPQGLQPSSPPRVQPTSPPGSPASQPPDSSIIQSPEGGQQARPPELAQQGGTPRSPVAAPAPVGPPANPAPAPVGAPANPAPAPAPASSPTGRFLTDLVTEESVGAQPATCTTGGRTFPKSLVLTVPAGDPTIGSYARADYQVPPGLVRMTATVGLVDGPPHVSNSQVNVFIQSGSTKVYEKIIPYGTAFPISVNVAAGQRLRIQASASGERRVCVGDSRLDP